MPEMNSKRQSTASMIQSPEKIEIMREAGRLTAKVLEAVRAIVRPGFATGAIDDLCEDYTNTALS